MATRTARRLAAKMVLLGRMDLAKVLKDACRLAV